MFTFQMQFLSLSKDLIDLNTEFYLILFKNNTLIRFTKIAIIIVLSFTIRYKHISKEHQQLVTNLVLKTNDRRLKQMTDVLRKMVFSTFATFSSSTVKYCALKSTVHHKYCTS